MADLATGVPLVQEELLKGSYGKWSGGFRGQAPPDDFCLLSVVLSKTVPEFNPDREPYVFEEPSRKKLPALKRVVVFVRLPYSVDPSIEMQTSTTGTGFLIQSGQHTVDEICGVAETRLLVVSVQINLKPQFTGPMLRMRVEDCCSLKMSCDHVKCECVRPAIALDVSYQRLIRAALSRAR
jgi:hypothetical protein